MWEVDVLSLHEWPIDVLLVDVLDHGLEISDVFSYCLKLVKVVKSMMRMIYKNLLLCTLKEYLTIILYG